MPQLSSWSASKTLPIPGAQRAKLVAGKGYAMGLYGVEATPLNCNDFRRLQGRAADAPAPPPFHKAMTFVTVMSMKTLIRATTCWYSMNNSLQGGAKNLFAGSWLFLLSSAAASALSYMIRVPLGCRALLYMLLRGVGSGSSCL